jgi:hypothetical protein
MIVAAMTKPAMAARFETSPAQAVGGVSIATPNSETLGAVHLLPAGTVVAVNYLRIVPTTLPTPCHAPGRGGARNRRDRTSVILTARHVANLIAASRHAGAIGRPFTRMYSIHWEENGVAPGDIVAATGRFLDMMTKALTRHGSATAWLWVQENGDGKGAHVHVLTYIPAALAKVVARLQRRWISRISGNAYQTRVIRSRLIGGTLGVELNNPAHHAANLAAALSYVLKGADEDTAATFDLARFNEGGRCIGKRCGVSQNIGPAARATAGATI